MPAYTPSTVYMFPMMTMMFGTNTPLEPDFTIISKRSAENMTRGDMNFRKCLHYIMPRVSTPQERCLRGRWENESTSQGRRCVVRWTCGISTSLVSASSWRAPKTLQAKQALKSNYNDDYFQPMVVTVKDGDYCGSGSCIQVAIQTEQSLTPCSILG